jgi:hypothetical protein
VTENDRAVLRVALLGGTLPTATLKHLARVGWRIHSFAVSESAEILEWGPHLVHRIAADALEPEPVGLPTVAAESDCPAATLHERYLQALVDAHGPPKRLLQRHA